MNPTAAVPPRPGAHAPHDVPRAPFNGAHATAPAAAPNRPPAALASGGNLVDKLWKR